MQKKLAAVKGAFRDPRQTTLTRAAHRYKSVGKNQSCMIWLLAPGREKMGKLMNILSKPSLHAAPTGRAPPSLEYMRKGITARGGVTLGAKVRFTADLVTNQQKTKLKQSPHRNSR